MQTVITFLEIGNLMLTVWQPESSGDFDVPLWSKAGTEVQTYIMDGNQNVRQLKNAAGTVIATNDYDPFGNVTATGRVTPWQFSSEYRDAETGLIYYNYRYYAPTIGRWINRDPIEEQGGLNIYRTNGNNLLARIDLGGLDVAGADMIQGERILVTPPDKTNIDLFVGVWETIARIKRKQENESIKCKFLILKDPNGEAGTKFDVDSIERSIRGQLQPIVIEACHSIVTVAVKTANDIKEALLKNKCICGIFYVGHANPGILFLNGTDNITEAGGDFLHWDIDDTFPDTTPLRDLPTVNIMPTIESALFGCYTAKARTKVELGSWNTKSKYYWSRSIAVAWAAYFNAPTWGSYSSLNFEDGQIYTPLHKGGNDFRVFIPETNTNPIPNECCCEKH